VDFLFANNDNASDNHLQHMWWLVFELIGADAMIGRRSMEPRWSGQVGVRP
jgi:hypothetical protein